MTSKSRNDSQSSNRSKTGSKIPDFGFSRPQSRTIPTPMLSQNAKSTQIQHQDASKFINSEKDGKNHHLEDKILGLFDKQSEDIPQPELKSPKPIKQGNLTERKRSLSKPSKLKTAAKKVLTLNSFEVQALIGGKSPAKTVRNKSLKKNITTETLKYS